MSGEQRAISFLEALREQFENSSKSPALSSFKDTAWNLFLKRGLPHKKEDAFQYLPLSDFYSGSFEKKRVSFPLSQKEIMSWVLPECAQSYLTLVDGVYRPDLSNISQLPKQVVILPLQEAMNSYSQFLRHRLSQEIEREDDQFALCNTALQQAGLFLFVPPKTLIEQPVQLLHIIENSSSFPRIELVLGAQAELKCISRTVSRSTGSCWWSNLFSFLLEPHSVLDVVEYPEPMGLNYVFDAIRGTLKKGARFSAFSPTVDSKMMRKDIKLTLSGEEAQADLKGVSILSKQSESHVHILIEHAAPSTHSLQTFKSVLQERSRSSFRGKILVQPQALQTRAYQLNHNLLLGEHALAYSKPCLEIFADDVKASHGATMGQLDLNQLHYLRTRGIPEKEARDLLVKAFCLELIDSLPYTSVKRACYAQLKSI